MNLLERMSVLMVSVLTLLQCQLSEAGQAKPLIKVVGGYGSTDGAIAPLWFAKETRLFEKRGLDVLLVGMGTGAVSLRALIAKDFVRTARPHRHHSGGPHRPGGGGRRPGSGRRPSGPPRGGRRH